MLKSQFAICGILATGRLRQVKEESNEGQGVGKKNV